MRLGRRLVTAALCALAFACAASPADAQPPGVAGFVSGAPFAHGIAIDRGGNVLLTYDATLSTNLAKVSPAGRHVAEHLAGG